MMELSPPRNKKTNGYFLLKTKNDNLKLPPRNKRQKFYTVTYHVHKMSTLSVSMQKSVSFLVDPSFHRVLGQPEVSRR